MRSFARALLMRLKRITSHPAYVPVFCLAFIGVFMFALPGLAQIGTSTPQTPEVTSAGTGMTTFITWLASLVVSLNNILLRIMVAFIDLVMGLMVYNDFVNSAVVAAGWAIVRDTVNMFFVVALIYIAISTMFGRQNVQWQSQVPRLMIFAIVINFSRLIVGLMVDAGQVVMLTFANALRNVGAGNFLSIFAINQTQLSVTAFETNPVDAGGAFGLLTGAVAGIILTVAALTLILVITAVLAYRIVAIWALTIVAPLAWFIGGLGGLISKDPYIKWWSNFKCAVAIGPILTFFLWLTLAVAASGNLAANGFTTGGEAANVAGIAIAGFEADHLIAFVISFALIMVGLDAASTVCASSKFGFFNTALGFAGRNASLSGAARNTGRGALAVARAGRKVGSVVGEKSGLSNSIASSRVGLATSAGISKIQGGVLAAGAGLGLGAAGKQKHGLHEADELEARAKLQEGKGRYGEALSLRARATEARSHAAEAGKEMLGDLDKVSAEEAAKYLVDETKKGPPTSETDLRKKQMLYAKIAGDKKARAVVEGAGLWGDLRDQLGGKKAIKDAVKGDDKLRENLKAHGESRPDLEYKPKDAAGAPAIIGSIESKTAAAAAVSEITDLESLRKLDRVSLAAIQDNDDLRNAFRNQLQGLKAGVKGNTYDDNGAVTGNNVSNISLWDALHDGRGSGGQLETFKGGMPGFMASLDSDSLALQDPKKLAGVMADARPRPGFTMNAAIREDMVRRSPQAAANLLADTDGANMVAQDVNVINTAVASAGPKIDTTVTTELQKRFKKAPPAGPGGRADMNSSVNLVYDALNQPGPGGAPAPRAKEAAAFKAQINSIAPGTIV